jgi:hypothetical protein
MRRAILGTTLGFGTLILSVALLRALRADPASELSLATRAGGDIDYYALAVDQDGTPLPGVTFECVIFVPQGSSFDREPLSDLQIKKKVSTDASGRMEVHGHGEGFRVESANVAGHRWLYDKSGGVGEHWDAGDNRGYQYWSWGKKVEVGDPDNPAIHVFVKDGVKIVSAKVSRGGSYVNNDLNNPYRIVHTPWKPGFPRRPSLEGLEFVEKTSTSLPTTSPNHGNRSPDRGTRRGSRRRMRLRRTQLNDNRCENQQLREQRDDVA